MRGSAPDNFVQVLRAGKGGVERNFTPLRECQQQAAARVLRLLENNLLGVREDVRQMFQNCLQVRLQGG
jgi:hypothetical protein